MRFITFLYGVACYLVFLVVFLYFIAFVGDVLVPKSISVNAGGITPLLTTDAGIAFAINIALMLMFGLQHSIMARTGFKSIITKIIPEHTERSTYCMISGVALGALMYFWQPMVGIIWDVEAPMVRNIIWGLFLFGWALIFISTFLTDHFDLFGLRQVYLKLVKKAYTPVVFTEVLFYKWIRHPMMLGLLISFWAVPTMTIGHLLFSLGMSIYVFIGIHFGEKGLARELGQEYIDYTTRTRRVLPFPKS